MTISTRTPEGNPNRCPLCGRDLEIEPSTPPGDAPCPYCGSLLWFPKAGVKGQLVPDYGEPIILSRSEICVGRRKTCDICLPSTKVSALQCILTFREGYWELQDHESTNGTILNGKRTSQAKLRPGDRITIAGTTYTIDYAPPRRPPMSIA
jgi:hypothetical protein